MATMPVPLLVSMTTDDANTMASNEVPGKVDLESNKNDRRLDSVTLGLIESLYNHPNVCDINIQMKNPAHKNAISQWEQMYSCILPADLKNFYLTCNGIAIEWKYKPPHKKPINLGNLRINSLEKLHKVGGFSQNDTDIPTLADIEFEKGSINGIPYPSFDSRSKIFELDRLPDNSRVCLVYSAATEHCQELTDSTIWYLDIALNWHFLSRNFVSYFRLMLAHSGLPHWQALLTDYGLPEYTQRWYQKFAPLKFLQNDCDCHSKTGFVVSKHTETI